MAQQSHEPRRGMSDSTRERWHKHRASRGTSAAETSPQRRCPQAHGDWEPAFFPRAAPRRHIPPPLGGKGGLRAQRPLHRRGGAGVGGRRLLKLVRGARCGGRGLPSGPCLAAGGEKPHGSPRHGSTSHVYLRCSVPRERRHLVVRPQPLLLRTSRGIRRLRGRGGRDRASGSNDTIRHATPRPAASLHALSRFFVALL